MALQVRGLNDVKRAAAKLSRQFPAAFAGALYRLGVSIASEATSRAPVEFGRLRSSHYVSAPQGQGGKDIRVELGFGTVYAAVQHEGDFTHPRGGERHYLANAVQSHRGRALSMLARDTQRLAAEGRGFATSPMMPSKPPSGANAKSQRRIARGARNLKRRLRRGR
jgi:hypothetical protein